MTTLSGKTALVTGASRGIGRASALALGKLGAQVLIHYGRGKAEAETVANEIRAAGGRAQTISADLAAADGAHALAKQVRAIVGYRLDILVSNAGISKAATIEETTIADFDSLFAVNVRAPFFLVQQLLPILQAGSSIVFISSVAARKSVGNIAAYAATKGAIKMFTQGLSREVGDRGITVNNIQPGPIDTDLNPAAGEWAVPQKANTALNRYGSVDDIAALVAFVAGPESSYITGASLTVDGGTNA